MWLYMEIGFPLIKIKKSCKFKHLLTTTTYYNNVLDHTSMQSVHLISISKLATVSFLFLFHFRSCLLFLPALVSAHDIFGSFLQQFIKLSLICYTLKPVRIPLLHSPEHCMSSYLLPERNFGTSENVFICWYIILLLPKCCGVHFQASNQALRWILCSNRFLPYKSGLMI